MTKIDDIYKQLDSIHCGIKGADAVFHTYIGPKYNDSQDRLMVVGKATMGWESNSDPTSFVLEVVAKGDYSSHFWHFLRKLSCRLNGVSDPEDAYRRIVWSNLMRIGVNKKNPGRAAVKRQVGVCVELLREEIRYLRPTHLVFTTGNYYWEKVKDVIGSDDWEERASDIWEKMNHDFAFDMKILWTRHPQGWKKERKECAIKLITDCLITGGE